MDPSIFSVSISMLLLGFTAGACVDSLMTRYYTEKMKDSLQKGITTLIQKDKEIDQLKEENKVLKQNYERLYDATTNMTIACHKLMTLPIPSELKRTETYFIDGETDEEFCCVNTPVSTCEKSNTD